MLLLAEEEQPVIDDLKQVRPMIPISVVATSHAEYSWNDRMAYLLQS